MTKRILAFAVILAMLFTLVGCSFSGRGDEMGTTTENSEETTEDNTETLISDPDEAAVLLGYEKISSEYFTKWEENWIVPFEDAEGYIIAQFFDLDGDGDDELYILSLESGAVSRDDFDEEDLDGGMNMASPGNYYRYTFSVYESADYDWILADEEYFYSAADFGDNAVKTLYVTEGAVFFDEQLITSIAEDRSNYEDLFSLQMMTYDREKLVRTSFGDSDGKTIYRYTYISTISNDEYDMLCETLGLYSVVAGYSSKDSDTTYNVTISFDSANIQGYTVVQYYDLPIGEYSVAAEFGF